MQLSVQANQPPIRSGEAVESTTAGGNSTAIKGIPASDFNDYFDQVKRQVESVWKYPDGIYGVAKVGVVFTLDRDGNLLTADILNSPSTRLSTTAIDAMKKASPFPPMPDRLKDLANRPLHMQFTVTIGPQP